MASCRDLEKFCFWVLERVPWRAERCSCPPVQFIVLERSEIRSRGALVGPWMRKTNGANISHVIHDTKWRDCTFCFFDSASLQFSHDSLHHDSPTLQVCLICCLSIPLHILRPGLSTWMMNKPTNA